MQKFQCLQPKAQCGKFQAPSKVPEEGERGPGAKMLVPGFPDLGLPSTGRKCGEGARQYCTVVEYQGVLGSHTFPTHEGFTLIREENTQKGSRPQGNAIEEPQLPEFRGKLRHNETGCALDKAGGSM